METSQDELLKEIVDQQSTAEISKTTKKHKSKHHHKDTAKGKAAEENIEEIASSQQDMANDANKPEERYEKEHEKNEEHKTNEERYEESKSDEENTECKKDDEAEDVDETIDAPKTEMKCNDETEGKSFDEVDEAKEAHRQKKKKKKKEKKEGKKTLNTEASTEEHNNSNNNDNDNSNSSNEDQKEGKYKGKEPNAKAETPCKREAAVPQAFHRVFGVDIGKLEVLPGDELPPVLRDVLEWLEDHAIPAPEAMFEDNRKGKKVKALMQLYETTAPSDTSLLASENSIKAVATLLLVFLKSLPFPLIPTKYYFACIRVMCIHSAVSRYQQLKLIVLSLPTVKRHALLRLCLYLRKSCLPPHFLAKLFQNTLLRPTSKEQIRSRGLDAATALIEQAHFLSGEVDEPIVTGISVPPAPNDYQLRAVALYDYAAPQEYVISFKKGTEFTLTGKTVGSEWFEACTATSTTQPATEQHDTNEAGEQKAATRGIIPASYIQLCKVEESEVPPDAVPTLPMGVEEQLEKVDKRSLGYATMRTPRTSPTKRPMIVPQSAELFDVPEKSTTKSSTPENTDDAVPERPKMKKKKRRSMLEEKAVASASQTLGRRGAERRKEMRPGERWTDDTTIPPPPLSATPSPATSKKSRTKRESRGEKSSESSVSPPPPDSVVYPDYIPPPEFIPPPIDDVSLPPSFAPPQDTDIAPPPLPTTATTIAIPPPPPPSSASATTADDQKTNVERAEVDIAPPPLPAAAAAAAATDEQRTEAGKDEVDIAPPSSSPHQVIVDIAPPPADVDIAPPPIHPITVSSEPAKDEKKREAKLKKRYNIVKELLSTEETYVHQLELLDNEFCEPLNKNPRGLDKTDVAAMFSNLVFILQFHKKLLQKMSTAELAWTNDSCFAPLLQQAIPSFKLYSHYVNNYGSAMRIYRNGTKNKAFQKFVSQLDYTERLGGLCFESLLILPVQRIPRYVMLIESMLKNTPKDHPDYEPLSVCYNEITEIADQLNHEKLKSDRRERYYEAFATFDNFPQSLEENDSRQLVKTSSVTVSKEKLTLFVFDDSVALAKQHGQRYTCKRFVLLGNAQVLLRPGGCTITPSASGEKLRIETEKHDVLKALLQQTAASHKDLATEPREDGTPSTRDEEAARRKEIVGRIVECVEACKDSVKLLMKCYLKPLTKNSQSKMPALSSLDAKQIRSNTDSLLTFYRTLSDELGTRLASWDAEQTIADFFLEKKTEFKLFLAYANKHSQQLATIAAARENAEFKKLLRKLQKDGECELGLKELTELPLKNIADLKRLVKELALASPCSDDYIDLQLAFKELKTLCDTISRRGTTNKVQEMLGASPM